MFCAESYKLWKCSDRFSISAESKFYHSRSVVDISPSSEEAIRIGLVNSLSLFNRRCYPSDLKTITMSMIEWNIAIHQNPTESPPATEEKCPSFVLAFWIHPFKILFRSILVWSFEAVEGGGGGGGIIKLTIYTSQCGCYGSGLLLFSLLWDVTMWRPLDWPHGTERQINKIVKEYKWSSVQCRPEGNIWTAKCGARPPSPAQAAH